jgi:L-iditol 2-dehydrogenase
VKSAQFIGIREIKVADIPPPDLKDKNDVLLRMAAVGICGSDIHYYTEGKIGDQVLTYPFIAGHECSAIVERVGEEVRHLSPGDRVAVEPAISCGRCDQCMSGRENTCRHLMFLGNPAELSGSMVEYMVMPAKNCYKLSDTLTMAQAVIAEPLSIAIYTLRYLDNLATGKLAILGAGPIGLSVLLEAGYRGWRDIYVTDKIDSRLSAAHGAGAKWTGNPDKIDIVSEILQNEPLQLDVVIECCGEQEAIDQAIELLKPGGILLIVGIPSVDRIDFDMSKLRQKEIHIQNVRRQNKCLQPAIDRLAAKDIEVDFLLTHRGKLADTQELYDLVADYRDGVIKAVVEIDSS